MLGRKAHLGLGPGTATAQPLQNQLPFLTLLIASEFHLLSSHLVSCFNSNEGLLAQPPYQWQQPWDSYIGREEPECGYINHTSDDKLEAKILPERSLDKLTSSLPHSYPALHSRTFLSQALRLPDTCTGPGGSLLIVAFKLELERNLSLT